MTARAIQLMVAISLVAIVIALVMKWVSWMDSAIAAGVLLLVSVVVALRARHQRSQSAP